MSIQTESTYNVVISGVTVDTIGLSDTMDNYTWDEIKDYNYVGSWTEIYRQISHRSPSNTTYVGYAASVGDCPFACSWSGGGYSKINISGYGTTQYNFDNEHGIYRKLVLLHDTTDNYPMYITNTLKSNFKIITEFDAKKYVLEYDNIRSMDGTFYYLYDGLIHQSLKYHTNIGAPDDDDTATILSFRPYFIIEYDSTYYVLRADLIAFRTLAASYMTNSTFAVCYNQFADVTATSSKSSGIGEAQENWFSDTALETAVSVPFVQNLNSNNVYYCDHGKYITRIEFGVNNSGFTIDYAFKDMEDLLIYIAGTYGIHFKIGDKYYKPVITQNFVVGYTEDLDTVSDLDNYTDTDHDMPVVPPEPAPPVPPSGDDDNNDPVSTAGAPFATGLAHYYVTTAGSTALSQISEAMSTWDIDATKKDLYKNLISCKLIKPPAGIPSTPSVFEIYGVKPQYQGADITIPAVDGNPDITFGPYNIDRKFNDFRDFAPYTKVEINLPYCGWCALPSHVVGRSVSVHYYTDVIAATCKAVVFCGNNIVAEAAGVIGLDIPFASENVGAKVAAATSGLLSYGQGALQASAGIGQMAATRSSQGLKNAAGGLSQVISGYTQMAMAANENWTEICGKNGDGCCLSGATDIIIKITRPKYGGYDEAPYVPPGFAHSVGFVSGKQVRVSNITGLLIADNVDTSGISGATDAERAEIKRVLETGLIVNSAPPEE